jgi:hypothetical protein
VEAVKEYLLEDETKLEIGKPDLERSELKRMSPFYYRKNPETKLPDKQSAPTLYCKFRTDPPNAFYSARFYSFDGQSLNVEDLVGKKCIAQLALRIESIWVGTKVSIQFKVHEANIKVLDYGANRRLLSRLEEEVPEDELE